MNVLIIGGGISGAAAAISMARAGIESHLVEARPERVASSGALW
jgi:2-polyprenyl-6-methoxyphenol hydroxylase-like FAD-dependent oxidoreductase